MSTAHWRKPAPWHATAVESTGSVSGVTGIRVCVLFSLSVIYTVVCNTHTYNYHIHVYVL